MFKKVHLTLTAVICATAAFSQSGAIKVHLFDKATNQAIPFANVLVEKSGTQVSGGTTDIDGYVTLKPLDPGEYDIEAVFEGYEHIKITDINVGPDKTRYEEVGMTSTVSQIPVVHIVKDKIPLISPTNVDITSVGKEDMEHMAVTGDVTSIAASTAGVYQSDVGGSLNMRGARSDNTQYIIDGVKVSAGDALSGLPQNAIEEVSVITGGVPAKYGDVTGGIVEINTVSASPKFFGSVQGITSELLDPYGDNDINFVIGGPLLSKRDTATHTKNPIVDFVLSGEFKYNQDDNPDFVGSYHANADTLAEMQKYPLLVNPQGGFYPAADLLTADQITHTAANINSPAYSASVNGKVGIKINNNVRIVLGGTYEYDNARGFSTGNELLNSTQDGLAIATSYRTFVKLTQRFPNVEGKDAKKSIIKNAYYTIQLAYDHANGVGENANFKDNLFDYGYVGQFQQYFANDYSLKYGRYGLGYYQTVFADSAYTFKPGTQNPLLANYTSEVYNLIGAKSINSPTILQQDQGIVNGGGSVGESVYSLWTNTGVPYTGYGLSNNNHLDFTANFSADIKDHAIQVGFEYEQNVYSSYGINAYGLWSIMDNDANYQLKQLDTNHPYLVSAGQYNTYGYNRLDNAATQLQFDKSLRAQLGLAQNSTTWIQPDMYAPSTYSLSMFSASELLGGFTNNNGLDYSGYNYLGKLTNTNVTLDDFFNQVDANGNNTYPVAPYHPIYIAGYIQDHFDIKNLKFDVGLRVDDFNANQPVLKDPYLLVPAKTVAEVEGTGLGTIPSNMGSNYVVYVNQNPGPTEIVGYRNGNNWYNSSGNLIPDASVLAAATATGGIQPYLENPSQTNIGPTSFTTYTPKVNVSPRIAFSFPISDVANFFAHYDILTQRPQGTGYNQFDPFDYEFIESKISGLLPNPNLAPTETTDYELGFSQVLNEQKTSALTIQAFYRDLKDEVQAYRYYEAYPVTYLAYNNIDFGTTKGLEVKYDLRRVNNVKFSANYTLQFADGTGSGPNSGYNLANSGEPNLQIPQPLSNDQRHTILLDLDYHYSSGGNYNGPVWKSKSGKAIQIFANTGFNLSLTAGSGTPYTEQSNATTIQGGVVQHYGLIGSVNGENLPWHYRVDLKIDKEFPVIIGKSKGDKAKHCDVIVYLAATNLLNTENLLSVYTFTGSATDDGYLASLAGQQYVASQVSPQAFTDQYKIKEQAPGNFSLPRQLKLGVQFGF